MGAEKIVAIVDDDESVLTAVSGLVRSAGFTVRRYASADAYLADPTLPIADCIVSDIHMPGSSGFDLLADLQRRVSPPPVLLMTGRIDEAIIDKARAGGAIGVLSKPFDAEDLFRYLADYLHS